MQQTSILAFQTAKTNLSRTQTAVYDALEAIGPATNRQLAKHLGYEINSVTPRTLELRTKGKVVKVFEGEDMAGRKAIHWGTPQQKADLYGS